MEPLKTEKRIVATFLAYRRRGDQYEFFLQKRNDNARASKGMFGVFGGGIESGESPEQGLIREVKEELNYRPTAYRYFSRYEHASVIFHMFIEEVDSDFESTVVIGEGEYGKFFTADEAAAEPKATDMVRLFTKQVTEYLVASQ